MTYTTQYVTFWSFLDAYDYQINNCINQTSVTCNDMQKTHTL